MKNTYKFEIHGKTGNGNTYTTTGEVSGNLGIEYIEMMYSVFLQSFQQLTGGKAVFGNPGIGCQGPYSITHLFLSMPGAPIPTVHPAIQAAQPLNNDGSATLNVAMSEAQAAELRERWSDMNNSAMSARDYPQQFKPSAIPPGQQGDSTMSNPHHPHHHHKAAEAPGADEAPQADQDGGSSTSADSTNPPADQVGSQTIAADAPPASEPVAEPVPESQPVSDAAQTADSSGDSREGL